MEKREVAIGRRAVYETKGCAEVDAVVVLVAAEQSMSLSELVDASGKRQAGDGDWNQDRRAEPAKAARGQFRAYRRTEPAQAA